LKQSNFCVIDYSVMGLVVTRVTVNGGIDRSLFTLKQSKFCVIDYYVMGLVVT
jgi:hypothetical protein